MKKLAVIAFCVLVLAESSLGQSASSTWPLTSTSTVTFTTLGNVTGQNESFGNMSVNGYTGPSTSQRVQIGAGGGAWPAETNQNETRYIQFAISPNSGFGLNVTSVTLYLGADGGGNMKANIWYSTDSTFSVRTQLNSSTLNLANGSLSLLSYAPTVTVNNGQTFYLRIYPWYTTSASGKYVCPQNVVISGTSTGGTDPAIVLSTLSLDNFGAVVAGNVSSTVSYTISGVNLVSNIDVKAPAGFQVSTDSATYTDSLSVTQSAGIVPSTKIFARFAPSLALGSLSANIAHTSDGATTKTLDVSGVAIASEPTTLSTVAFGAVTGTSIEVNFSGGDGGHRIVVARPGGLVSWIPNDGSGVGNNSNYAIATDQGNGNKVVYNDTGGAVTVTGLAVGTQYHFAVYEYNVDSSNSQNYLTVSPGTGNQTTLTVPGLSVNPSTVSFGNVIVNTTPVQRSFSLSGTFLTPETGAITVTAPDSLKVSTTIGSNFASSVQVPYTGGAFSTTIYVQFAPASIISYNDTVTNAGGGAGSVNVIVSGRGISQAGVAELQPVGFASCGTGTTGGVGGSTVVVTTAQQLANIIKPREKDVTTPLIIYISGTLVSDSNEISIKHTANLSILGLGTDAKIQGFGFKIWNAQNIIVRNISFSDCSAGEGDCISIETCNNVWIDHCSFSDSPSSDPGGNSHDGELDVKKESYNVTLSWNHFQNHRKTCLLGHSTSETGDTAMKVTYVHNWFEGTYSRHPRVRYAKAHLLNNLYTGVGEYGVGSTCQAQILMEGNYFENTTTPTLISGVNDPGGTLSHDPAGYLKALNNYTTGSGTIVENIDGYNFDPGAYYAYSADDAQSVRALVMAGAGAGTVAALGDTTSLLPVELTSFIATGTRTGALLTWKTATEMNCYGFEVERRAIGIDNSWTRIGFVPGVGTSNSLHKYSFMDNTVEAGLFEYRIRQIDKDGSFKYSTVMQVEVGAAPRILSLGFNFPNPFNPTTNIEFSVPTDGRAVVKVYNILGQEVATLFDGQATAGRLMKVTFDASRLSSGVYFSRLEVGGNALVKRMVLMK